MVEKRVRVRLPEAMKRRIEIAAGLAGQTVSAFIAASAVAKADELIEHATTTELNVDDARRFVEIVTVDVDPTPRMTAAARSFSAWEERR